MMQVMVMNDDPAVQVRVSKGLMAKGFQVVGMETVARACDYVKADPVDLLILGERVSGRLSHSVALAAECANPMVSTMILTDRRDAEVEELYELLPSLYALIGPDNDPSIIATLALAAVANPEEIEARLRRNAVARDLQRDLASEEADLRELEAGTSYYHDDAAAEADTSTWGAAEDVFALADAPTAAPDPRSEPRFSDVFAALREDHVPSTAPIMIRPAEVAGPGTTTAAPALGPATRSEPAAPGPRFQSVGPTPAAPISTAAAPAAPVSGPAVGLPLPVPARSTGLSLPGAASLPEVVPARPIASLNRAEWIAAKVQELEAGHPRTTQRMHLA